MAYDDVTVGTPQGGGFEDATPVYSTPPDYSPGEWEQAYVPPPPPPDGIHPVMLKLFDPPPKYRERSVYKNEKGLVVVGISAKLLKEVGTPR